MILYSTSLLLHVLGALGLFIGLGLEWLGIRQINNVNTLGGAKEWTNFLASLKHLFSISGGLVLFTGLYMAIAVWKDAAWIIIAFIALVFLSINGAVFTGKRIAFLQKQIDLENDNLSQKLLELLHDQKLLKYFQLRSTIALGVIFLMTFKPEIITSLVAIIAAFIIGYIPLFSFRKSPEPDLAEADE